MGPTGKKTGACGEKRGGGFGLTGVGKQQKKCMGVFIEGESMRGCVEGGVGFPFCRPRGKTLSLID